MDIFTTFVETLFSIGLTLGVGSSTFALIFFIRALQDGVIDDSEKRFMHTVYVVLRIGMVCLLISLLLLPIENHIPQLVLLAIIFGNALLMQYKYMPMKYGPVLAGGSWYSLFFVSETPIATLAPVTLAGLYIAFLIAFYIIFTTCKRKFTTQVTPK